MKYTQFAPLHPFDFPALCLLSLSPWPAVLTGRLSFKLFNVKDFSSPLREREFHSYFLPHPFLNFHSTAKNSSRSHSFPFIHIPSSRLSLAVNLNYIHIVIFI